MTTDNTPTTPAPAPVDPALQQRVAEAIRTATCNGDCGETEEQCVQRRIQPVVWHFGVLAEVSGTPERFAAAVLAELAPELARAQLGDRTREELVSLAVNASNALRDEKRHYAIACQEIARLKELIDRLGPTEQQQRHRAEQAEAALTRVRDLADRWDRDAPPPGNQPLTELRAALTPPAAPEVTP